MFFLLLQVFTVYLGLKVLVLLQHRPMLLHIYHGLEILVIIDIVNLRFFCGHSLLPRLPIRLHLHHNYVGKLLILVFTKIATREAIYEGCLVLR